MIDNDLRRVVFRLRAKHFGSRRIAKALSIARSTVAQILKEGTPEREPIHRPSGLDPYLEMIQQLYTRCDRNLVRVCEELELAIDTAVPYSTLTRFCRDHGLGESQEKVPAGEYVFGPGVEMQHDTSPVTVTMEGIERPYQVASLKLGYSRARFIWFYRRFTRFHCKDFLSRAFTFFECVCARCMIDNTSVIVSHGTGKDAVMAPELQTLEKRFGFHFEAHEKGDANRSAKVERDFDFVQRNFLAGRRFRNDADLNRQAVEWCHKKNNKNNRKLRVPPSTLLPVERAHAKALPEWIPPVYQIHTRRVGVDGLVQLDANEYSAPARLIGRTITVRETMDEVVFLDGAQEICRHPRFPESERGRSVLPDHARQPRRNRVRTQPQPEELWLVAHSPVLAQYVAGLREHTGRSFGHHVRKLYGLCHDYDSAAIDAICTRAAEYGLFDVARLETMLLQEVGAKLFGFRQRRPGDEGPGNVTPVSRPDPSLLTPDAPTKGTNDDHE